MSLLLQYFRSDPSGNNYLWVYCRVCRRKVALEMESRGDGPRKEDTLLVLNDFQADHRLLCDVEDGNRITIRVDPKSCPFTSQRKAKR